MIKLVDYQLDGTTRMVFLSKSSIYSMERIGDMTKVCLSWWSLNVKETPEEILAMPDINAINWEQRRYEIVKELFGAVYKIGVERNGDYIPATKVAEKAVKFADALVKELKNVTTR